MFRKLFGAGKTDLPDISKWNEIGREVASEDCAAIEAYHRGKSEQAELYDDPRGLKWQKRSTKGCCS